MCTGKHPSLVYDTAPNSNTVGGRVDGRDAGSVKGIAFEWATVARETVGNDHVSCTSTTYTASGRTV